jgi:hypothetical protein
MRSTATSSRTIALFPHLPHPIASPSLSFADPPPVAERINCPDKLLECSVWPFHGIEPDFHATGWMAPSVRDAMGTDTDRNRDLINSA